MPYPVFPSLSRAPRFKSTRKIEDGTIKDPAESGYVSTRPRFTRLRRTFGISYEYLNSADLRALDRFETQTVQGMAGAFYLPNLLPNGGFLAGDDGGIDSWDLSDYTYYEPPIADAFSAGVIAADMGESALSFVSGTGSYPGYAYAEKRAACAACFPVSIGDVLGFSAFVSAVNPCNVQAQSGALFARLIGRLTITYSDDTQQSIDQIIAQNPTSGFVATYASFTIPAGAAGVTAASAMFSIVARVGNDTYYAGAAFYASYSTTVGEVVFTVDRAGLSVTSAAQPFGRMAGSAPLAAAVRFTKVMQVRDMGWAGGQKTYGADFEVSEI